MKDDCIFCKLANGVFATNVIYEDNDFTVILDAGPANPGHSLILPKAHSTDIFDTDENTIAGAMKLAKRVAARLTEVLNCDGVNIVQNSGEAAGQTVSHYHVHVIPRFKNDGQTIGWKVGKPSDDEQAALCDKLAF